MHRETKSGRQSSEEQTANLEGQVLYTPFIHIFIFSFLNLACYKVLFHG